MMRKYGIYESLVWCLRVLSMVFMSRKYGTLTLTDFTSQIICLFTASLHTSCNLFLGCFTR